MNLLTAIQMVCAQRGLVVPAVAVNSANLLHAQMAALANAVCVDLVNTPDWQGLTRELTFTSVAGENQGKLSALGAVGFSSIVPDSFWNRTTRLPFYGPVSPADWQQWKTMPYTGPYSRYRFRGDELLFTTTVPTSSQCVFEYATKFIVRPKASIDTPPTPVYANDKEFFTADDDEFLLDGNLLMKGLEWMWLKSKGLPYAVEFDLYEGLKADIKGRDGSKKVIDTTGNNHDGFRPGIMVPLSGWNT